MAAVLIAVTGALVSGRTGLTHDAPDTTSIEAVADKLAEGQARERTAINADLAAAAEEAQEHLAGVLRGLASAVPVDTGKSAQPARSGDVDQWNEGLALAASALEAVPEGTSEQTVTRAAFLGAANLLQSAAASYHHLLDAPADQHGLLTAAVADQREAAVHLWQAGAAQLDTLTVEAGGEHIHVFLAPDGDPAAVPQEFQEPESH
ncbi:hypothetical protein FDW83_07765 [Pseudarthrobacter sp. NamE2]|uniref:hypothetical protein n=1 Tax=Pseudarthrobacter sp. NamE2 TaxID=2576838 RepID=UPI0010FDB12F|nr:hypothetical protein [Pseudarthrobacter sp. NamE2]TLM83876.1 hypothetical protein FDW83_07765 [Pseudarthrobacter sp. NamE2]